MEQVYRTCKVSVCERKFVPRRKSSVTCEDCTTEGLYRREYNLLLKYGITIAEFDQMFEGQGMVCAICKEATPKGKGFWHVDHDHITGKVRGILCDWCNRGLGQYRDNVDYLLSAVTYLMHNNSEKTNKLKIGGEHH